MSVITFKAQPYSIGDYTILKLPNDASAKLPSRGQVMVRGTINDFAFQTALEPDGQGGHWLHVDTALQKSAGVAPGEAAVLAIESTKDWPEPVVPPDWQSTLKSKPEIEALWQKVTPMARWEWLRWIGATNNTETRKRRIDVACSKLSRGERRPCCFNRSMCCVPEVSRNGQLL